MNNNQMLAAAAARRNRIQEFYKDKDRLDVFLNIYKDYNQEETNSEYLINKNKLLWYFIITIGIGLLIFAFLIVAILMFTSDEKISTIGIVLLVFSGVLLIIYIYLAFRYFDITAKKWYLKYKLESFDDILEYTINDIEKLKTYSLSKFLATPPNVPRKLGFLSGVYAVHCLNRQYDETDRIPIFLFKCNGFRNDAWLLASDIKNDWKTYKKSDYDGTYEFIFDYLSKYNLSFRNLKLTFIENVEFDLEEAVDDWCDILELGNNSWMG